MKHAWLLAGLAALGLLYLLLRDPDYAAFDAQREDWHRRCDAYIGVTVSVSNRDVIADCKREMDELLAYAKRKGWN